MQIEKRYGIGRKDSSIKNRYVMSFTYYDGRWYSVSKTAIVSLYSVIRPLLKRIFLVGQIPYHGLSHEHPMNYLERFEDMISAIKVKGVPEDYVLWKLFNFSLSGEALHWLKQLPPWSLKSWSDIKNAFLCNFFDEARA